ncbi:phosphatidate cytidylyltransferase [Helicobacter mesocricetorum]|uniref:phosphatidate cytidylyltransferase n=1 Tax=Helicobacter mesocricetorum TaxID=87012 RepID=UPI000CF140EB|nr:phosphatidate cytidylyltransferase [Helicobacter mesocricetorum]
MLKNIESKRLYTAAFMLIAIILIVIFHSPFLLWLILGIACIISFYESYQLYIKTKPNPIFTGLLILFWISLYWLQTLHIIFVILIILASYQAYTQKGNMLCAMPFIYPTIPFAFLYFLYLDYSINAIIWLLFIVSLTDSFAYFGGKLFGGKLFNNSCFCPTSPNKTKEGVLIGVSVSVIISTLVGLGVCSFFTALLLTLTTSLSSVFGDLYESFLKRQAKVKDSGSLFPGHGGMLDRLDGYFFGGIVLYVMLELSKWNFD